MILGIDEVGRGCLAGPVAAGAVVLGPRIRGLKDSKVLSRQQREKLDAKIRSSALAIGVGWASVDEINQFGLTEAVRRAMHRAVATVNLAVDKIIVDGNYNYFKAHRLGHLAETLVSADAKVPAVSAASIVAKVARDSFMAQLSLEYPQFGFESHVGYATPQHRQALRMHGVTAIHRLNFKQVRAVL